MANLFEMLTRYGITKGSEPYIYPRADVQALYEGMFDRIMKTHPLDYFWIWTHELWYSNVVDETTAIDKVKEEFLDAYNTTQSMKTPFQLATLGWQHGVEEKPAEFDNSLPKSVPFGSLWGENPLNDENRLDKLSADRVKWAFTWMEEDWGLIQPQLEVNRIFDDLSGTIATPNAQALLTKFWRTTILQVQLSAMGDLTWVRGKTGSTLSHTIPAKNAYIDAFYLDWATQNFGPEAASTIASTLATIDKAGEEGENTIPKPIEWDGGKSGAIMPNMENWSTEQSKYAFVSNLESAASQIVGAGNKDRFDYFLKTYQALRKMGEYGCLRSDYETALSSNNQSVARTARLAMKTLYEDIVTLTTEKVVNSSDLGELKHLNHLNYHYLMKRNDAKLNNKTGIEPGTAYTGKTRIIVNPARTQVDANEALTLRVTVMKAGLSHPTTGTLYYRVLGASSYHSFPLTHVGRAVYSAMIPAQTADYEFYVAAAGTIWPVTSPSINHTVVVKAPNDNIGGDTNLSGKVITSVTGQTMPVIGATVTVIETGQSVVTGNDGTYSLTDIPEGKYTVKIEMNGFSTLRLTDVTTDIGITELFIGCGLKGDINDDGKIGLEEAIKALKVVSGICND